eukprot:gnl/MRDRNA2_/MRDRNA2_66953_c0_seq3.p1 gnl/MRDRNA2_/MRDRNA2_66953_c0~~gnl/MRDRNA2_/MRDRNA2_66953_c0_seq3.p1  ORF type:complete len:242 (+),score=25.09 gnl/MRDRNA2_/MRDRNA2_66953_c0_seq3:122-847(+)
MVGFGGSIPLKYYILTVHCRPQTKPAKNSVDSQARNRFFILAGQSNMVGRGDPKQIPPSLASEVADRVFLCYDHDQNFAMKFGFPRATCAWKPLTTDLQYSYGGKCHHFGPEFSLAKVLLEQSPGDIYFAKFAMGSTNLHTDWCPDGEYFRKFVEFIKGAITSAGQDVVVGGIFWLQGESDSTGNAAQVNAYEENFVRFFAELRRSLAFDRLPVVASQVDFVSGPEAKGKRPKKLISGLRL